MSEFLNVEAEMRRQIEDLQKKHSEARTEIDEYQRRYLCALMLLVGIEPEVTV